MRRLFAGRCRFAVVAAVLVLSGTACTERTIRPTDEPPFATGDAPVIEALVLGSELPDALEDDIKKTIDAKLNIDLRIVPCLGDACKTQLSMRLAEGNPPDLFYVDRRTLARLVKQNQLLDLSPYVDLLQPAIDFAGGGKVELPENGGKLYGLAIGDNAFQFTYWVREDWLDKLGLQPPATLDELARTARAFTFGDPDGNGKNDTYGFGGNPDQALGPIFGAFGTTYPGHFYRKNGQLVNSLTDPGMVPALAYIQSLIEAGVVDPDLLSNKTAQHEMKAFQGQVGLFYYNWPNMMNDNKVKEWQPLNPNARWVQLPSPQGPGGASYSFYDPGAASVLVMPKTLQRAPAKLDKIIRLLRYVTSPEGSRLVMYGLEGKHYTVAGNQIVPTAQMSQMKYAYLYQLVGRDELTYLKTKFPKQEPYFSFAMRQPRLEVLDSFIDPPDDYSAADAERYIKEELYKFIYGKRPLDSYGEFLATLDTEYRYEAYRQAAERQLKSLGMIR
ncbi:extracellular solute-binding protein [Paenibacillus hodogayensis]|uniref:Extracellular solute-binding protein n=1 Tax=Paenibacillus hodogayensis TaxID=279208 RepID=A0ABV5VXS9_9BACL